MKRILELIAATVFSCAACSMLVPGLLEYGDLLGKYSILETTTVVLSVLWVGRSALALRSF